MTDHAHELRRYARKIAHPAGDVPSVMLAAADEIERLAARLEATEEDRARFLVEMGRLCAQCDALRLRIKAAEKAVAEAYQRGYATGQEEIERERDELLEALTALVRDSERVKEVMLREAGIGMIDEVGLDKARAAIARATGEQP